MKAWTVTSLAALAMGLAMTVGCGHQSAVPVAASGSAPPRNEEQLPFDRQVQRGGISPSSAVIPPGARIPAGTPVTVRLRAAIASATAKSGDTFEAVLVEPIVVNGQTLSERGAPVTGRVMEARAAGRSASPGYLRLALSSLSVNGKTSPVQSSSHFVKGASRATRKSATIRSSATEETLVGTVAEGGKEPVPGNAFVLDSANSAEFATSLKDVTVDPDRRLTFRLTEPIPLHD